MTRGDLSRLGGLAAALILCATAWPAQAKSFLLVPAGADAWMLLDPTGIEHDAGGVVRRSWVVTVQKSMVDGGPAQPGYVRTLSEYDCGQRQVRWLKFFAFTRDGEALLNQENQLRIWRTVDKSPEGAGAYNIVCGQPGQSSTISADSIGAAVSALMAIWDPPTASKGPLDEPIRNPKAKAQPAKSPAAPPKPGKPR